MKMQALRNGVKSLRSNVSTPCWVETCEAGRIGAAEGIGGRVIFADFSSRTPGKIYRKNSDSPHQSLRTQLGLQNKMVLGFIGSFYAYEGLPLLLEAFPKILEKQPETRLLLVGGGPEVALIKQKTKEMGLE